MITFLQLSRAVLIIACFVLMFRAATGHPQTDYERLVTLWGVTVALNPFPHAPKDAAKH